MEENSSMTHSENYFGDITGLFNYYFFFTDATFTYLPSSINKNRS